MIYGSTLTRKGQVTVPAKIRRSLGLKAGQPVRFRLTNENEVMIEKNNWQEDLHGLQTEVAKHLKAHKIKPLSDEQLTRAIDKAAAETVTREAKALSHD